MINRKWYNSNIENKKLITWKLVIAIIWKNFNTSLKCYNNASKIVFNISCTFQDTNNKCFFFKMNLFGGVVVFEGTFVNFSFMIVSGKSN